MYTHVHTQLSLSCTAVMRSRGLRVRFLEEMGIDEGALRREFYGAFFRAVVHPDALTMALPEPEEQHIHSQRLHSEAVTGAPCVTSGAGVTVAENRTSSHEPEPEPSSPGLTGYLIDEIHLYSAADASLARGGGTNASSSVNAATVGGNGESLQGPLLVTPNDSGVIGGLSATQHPYPRTAGVALPMFAPTADGSAFVVAGSLSARLSWGAAAAVPPPPPSDNSGNGALSENWNQREWSALPLPPMADDRALRVTSSRQDIEMTELTVTVPPPQSPGSFLPVVDVLRRPRHRHIRRLRDLAIRGQRRVERVVRRHRRGDVNTAAAQWRRALDVAEPQALYQLVGLMLAKAIVDDMRIDVTFSKVFYVALLQQPMTLEQRLALLAEVDQALHASLKWLLENNLDEIPEVGDLEVFFDATLALDSGSGGGDGGDDCEGTPALPQIVELKPGGSAIAVNESNKVEFVHLRSKFALEGAVETPMQAVREGFFSLLPDFAQLSFNAAELLLLVHGCPVSWISVLLSCFSPASLCRDP